jgi:hexosaminidase
MKLLNRFNSNALSKALFFFMVVGLLSTELAKGQNAKPFVVPTLQEWKGENGFLTIGKRINIVISPQSENVLKDIVATFVEDLKAGHPQFLVNVEVGSPKKGGIYFDTRKSTSANNEAYSLQIKDFVTISATSAQGCFWGTRTFLQLIENQREQIKLPKGQAYDYPNYPVRGFVLDVGRKFFSIEFLRDYVKMLSYYKINDFQIHLNDNGFKQFFGGDWNKTYSAFRLENDTYPNLTAKDGNYTKKEFIALQQLGNEYGVKIVPEIDVPAHSLAFVKAVPAIGSKKYGDDHLDINNPLTYEVIDNVYKEYVGGENPVFINDEVHIGTDEYAKEEAESFRKFTNHYINYIQGFGKKVRLWGALTHAKGNTPVVVKDVTMNVWYNGYADPKAMLDLGYDVLSTPDGWLYIVPAAGYYFDYLNNKKIYEKWNPHVIGNQKFDVNNKKIKGGSFAVWNDHVGNGITEKDVHDRVFKSIAVLSQKMWTADSILKYATFEAKAKLIGEGPGLNVAAKVWAKDSLVMAYGFDKKTIKDNSGNKNNPVASTGLNMAEKSTQFNASSFLETPIKSIGYNYTVSFWLRPSANGKDNVVLFSSNDSIVKLKQGNTGKLGFSRENYNYNFDYTVPENTWTHLTVVGNNKGTSLYVNGVLKEKLEGNIQTFANTKDKIAKVQTLFFPLQFIGDKNSGFNGTMKDLKVFNKILTNEQIKSLAK